MSTIPTAESIRAEAERRGAPGAGPRCRSCGSPIFFGLTTKGRRMPIDPAPVEDGNVVLVSLEARMETGVANLGRARAQRDGATPTDGGSADLPRVRVLRAGEHVEVDLPRYRSHFATCPQPPRPRREERKHNGSRAGARAMGMEQR